MSDLEPLTVRSALEEYAALEALSDLVKERQTELRITLQSEADRVSAQTGAAANFPLAGVGRAYVTEPSKRVEPTDEKEFASWLASTVPDEVQWRERIDGRRVAELVEEDPEIRRLLDDGGAIGSEPLLPEGFLDRLREDLELTEGGQFVDPATGELVPLRVVAASRPTLIVKIDAKAKARLRSKVVLARALPEGGE